MLLNVISFNPASHLLVLPTHGSTLRLARKLRPPQLAALVLADPQPLRYQRLLLRRVR